DFLDRFIALARESAPALLLAYTAAGLIHALLPKATIDWMARGSNFQQSLRGMLFGLPLPICSCGVLPLYRSLVQKGVPTAAAVTLLVATPELGIDAIFLSFTMVDGPFAVARVLTAAILAISVGLLAVRFIRPIEVKPDAPVTDETRVPLNTRIVQGLKVGLGDLVDSTAPWIVLGLSLAAALSPLVEDGSFLAGIPDWLEVPAFALLGLPIYVCASGATPLAAVLIAGGVSPGAALAFLLTGPATNATTFGILGDLHGRRAAILFAICIGVGAIGCGYAVDAVLPTVDVGIAQHIHHSQHSTTGEQNSFGISELFLGLLAILFLASIFRKGPRAFLTQVFGLPTDSSGSTRSDCCSTETEKPEPAPGGG
ncbi:MAG: permease, partial [Planctomycetota bacterium]|nr:permease [Planctomycetota bacterium]